MENAENEIPVPTRLSALETGLEKILSLLSHVAPVAAFIPGATAVVTGVEAVGTVIDEVLHDIDGTQSIDPAALAAQGISKSTGNEALDTRLGEVEMLIHALIPVVKAIAKHFGVDLSALEVTAQPMTVA